MKKVEHSPLDGFVKWFFPKLLPLVPKWMSANIISTIGLIISLLVGVFAYFGASHSFLYYIAAFLMLSTWVTDTMDGIVARDRGQTSRLGHYLDHFGDSWNIIFISIGLYLPLVYGSTGPESHMVIGLLCGMVYLMFHIDGHIKVKMLDTLELPFIGPTEIRFLVTAIIIGQGIFSPGHALNELSPIIGNNGWLTRFWGFKTGLSFLDLMGTISLAFGVLGILQETIKMLIRMGRLDKEGK